MPPSSTNASLSGGGGGGEGEGETKVTKIRKCNVGDGAIGGNVSERKGRVFRVALAYMVPKA